MLTELRLIREARERGEKVDHRIGSLEQKIDALAKNFLFDPVKLAADEKFGEDHRLISRETTQGRLRRRQGTRTDQRKTRRRDRLHIRTETGTPDEGTRTLL